MKRPLAPSFIEKLDEELLLHRPDTWSTRIHMVLYYGISFILLVTGICFIVPFDPGSGGQTELWTVLLSIIGFIGFIFWLIYLLRFNVFKRYGSLGIGDGVKTFVLFFICIGVFVLLPYVPSYVESVRANNRFGNDEVVNDLNSINTKLIQLEYDSLDRTWDEDSLQVVNSFRDRNIDYNNNQAKIVGSRYGVIDTATLHSRLLESDSAIKINDSFYVLYSCPTYAIIDPYEADKYSMANFLSSKELYYRVLKNFQRPDSAKVRKELIALLDKYDPGRYAYDFNYYNNENAHVQRIKARYKMYYTEGRFNRIISTKYQWKDDDFLAAVLRVFFYVTLGLSLLVFIFRHSTVRTFFLTLLSAFVLTLLTSMIVAITARAVSDPFLIILIYYILFGAIAFLGLKTSTRNVVSGIALNMFVFCTAFIPLVATAYYYWQLRIAYQYEDSPVAGTYEKYFANETTHYFYAEIIGAVLLLVMIEFVFRKLYRNWYAKPEQ